jgi:hypothetical protein
MADCGVSVESIELALLSEIESSSATMMKNAYLPDSPEPTGGISCVPQVPPASAHHDEGMTGPNALVYVTKLVHRISGTDIQQMLNTMPGRAMDVGTGDFYTVVLTISMQLGDPVTTRFINGTIEVVFPRGVKILTYSPKEKGAISAIIKKGGDAVAITRSLDMVSARQSTATRPGPEDQPFGIVVGPCEKITGNYSQKTGYTLDIPAGFMLEYQGMIKNDHEMFWECYPPMPPQEIEFSGKDMLVVFSFMVRAPKNTPLKITAHIDGRVKGTLWGMISVKGSVVL